MSNNNKNTWVQYKMDKTPVLKKRTSLTLSRLHKVEDSPKRRFEDTPSKAVTPTSCSDAGIECTPPHKKYNLDDSIDYSPKCFDNSFSPSGLLSQTLGSDSPEVGWKWGRRIDGASVLDTMTPDSAYAADSSFASAGSSSTDARTMRTRSDSQLQRVNYEIRREEQRKAYEQQMRRAEKLRADEMLKKRYAKLQEQLRESEARKQREKENESAQPKAQEKVAYKTPTITTITSPQIKLNDTLDDFLNDSDSDCLLIEATQQVESKIIELTQQTTNPSTIASSAPATSTTPAAEKREKRSSLYMKFLEDDEPDDWFLSLDDVIQQATAETPKRSAFQRHRSMPATNTATATTTTSATTSKVTTASVTGVEAGGTELSASKIKRHASSHALSPTAAPSSYRARQLHMRK